MLYSSSTALFRPDFSKKDQELACLKGCRCPMDALEHPSIGYIRP